MPRRGEALDLTEAEIQEAARITPKERGEARAWGRRYLPAPFGGMLEAERLDASEVKELRRRNDLPEL